MDDSRDEDVIADNLPINNEYMINNRPVDDKAAFVVVVAPENLHDDRIQQLLAESLRNEGIKHAIIRNSKMNDAQASLRNKIDKIKVENLIVVVIADGFYHNNGEAIIFEDGYILLDSFIHPIIAIADDERQCKSTQSAFDSFEFLLRQKLYTDELPP